MAKTTKTSKKSKDKGAQKDNPDNLFAFQFQIFNPVRWFFHFLEKLERDKTGKITLTIPFIWYLAFLLVFFGGGGLLGVGFTAPITYLQGQLAERNVWVTKPTPTPKIIVPTPAPVLVTRLGVIKATYQVQNLLPTNTPTPVASNSGTLTPNENNPTPTTPIARYVLMTDTYKLIYLVTPQNLSLSKYIGNKALVTGMYSSQNNSITITALGDIEIIY